MAAACHLAPLRRQPGCHRPGRPPSCHLRPVAMDFVRPEFCARCEGHPFATLLTAIGAGAEARHGDLREPEKAHAVGFCIAILSWPWPCIPLIEIVIC